METDGNVMPHSHKPFGADGSCYYSDHTIGCYNVINEGKQLVLAALKDTHLNPDCSTFCIVDYGTADGGTSLPLINSCILELRSIYGDMLPIHIVYEDQPFNDFKSLFLRINGLTPGSKDFFAEHKNVYVTVCGTSFYQQCLPPNSVDFGFSSTAMHWLREKPCDITDGLHHTMIKNPDEELLFKRQAAQDWELLLLNRCRELKPGGLLVLIQLAKDSDGQYLGNTQYTKKSMFSTMTEIWREMLNENRIKQEEFHRATFINYYRTVEEFSEPFLNKESQISKAGLRLCSIETKIVRCPYHEKWVATGGDAKQHAKWFVPTTRTWSNHTFFSALSCERNELERNSIVDELFQRYEQIVAESPIDHGMDYVHAYILIKKEVV